MTHRGIFGWRRGEIPATFLIMAFCPKCRSEYIDTVTTCEDCGVPLVEELPPHRGSGSGELVEIWTTHGEMDAQLIRALLESHGINAVFRGESLRLTHGFTVDGLAEVRILVASEHVNRAREIMSTSEGMGLCKHCGQLISKEDGACRYCGRTEEG